MKKKIILFSLLVFLGGNSINAVELKIKDKSTEIYTDPDGPAAGMLFNNIIIEQVDERGQWVQAKITFWVPKNMVDKIYLEEKGDLTWDEVHKSPIVYQDRKITWICYLDKIGVADDGRIKWYLLARNLSSKDLVTRRDGLFFAYFEKKMERELKKYSPGDWVMITAKILGAGDKSNSEEFGYVIVEASGVEKVVSK
ncbi:MAG: hypothetical protein AB1498_02655 [bacterium]